MYCVLVNIFRFDKVGRDIFDVIEMEFPVACLHIFYPEIVGCIVLERERPDDDTQGVGIVAQCLGPVQGIYRGGGFHVSSVAHRLIIFATVIGCFRIGHPPYSGVGTDCPQVYRYTLYIAVDKELCDSPPAFGTISQTDFIGTRRYGQQPQCKVVPSGSMLMLCPRS